MIALRPQQLQLTRRQTQIIRLLASGMTAQQVATLLSISPKTVEAHTKLAGDRLLHDHVGQGMRLLLCVLMVLADGGAPDPQLWLREYIRRTIADTVSAAELKLDPLRSHPSE